MTSRYRHALLALTSVAGLLAASGAATAIAAPSAVAFGPAPLAMPPYVVRDGHAFERRPWSLPVSGYHLTGRFGDADSLWATVHTGLDFAADEGTTIRSVASGIVTSVEYDGSYGERTVVTLRDGTEVWYCHQATQAVAVGQQVAAGEPIGTVGSTGNTTGPHLHLEVRPHGGEPVDPFVALSRHGRRP